MLKYLKKCSTKRLEILYDRIAMLLHERDMKIYQREFSDYLHEDLKGKRK